MSWQAKPRLIATPVSDARAKPGPSAVATSSANVRVSNGLKEFLWLLSDSKQGRILDLGQVSQATLTFFIEKGFRVSTEDLLRAWKEFLVAEEENFRKAPVGNGVAEISPTIFADKFLETALEYPAEHFHGVLAWDIFDYLDAQLLPKVMDRLVHDSATGRRSSFALSQPDSRTILSLSDIGSADD